MGSHLRRWGFELASSTLVAYFVFYECFIAFVCVSMSFQRPSIGADAMRDCGLLQGLSSSRPARSMPSEETRMALE